MDDRPVAISGGAGSTEAHYDDMLTSARLVDTAGDAARDAQIRLVRTMTALPTAGAVLSPGSALQVAGQGAQLTIGSSSLIALGLELEIMARGVRLSVQLYQAKDTAVAATLTTFHFGTALPHVAIVLAGVADVAIHETALDIVLGPIRDPHRHPVNPIAVFARHFQTHLSAAERRDPGIVDDAVRAARIMTWGVPGMGGSFEHQVATILAAGSHVGLLRDSTPVRVTPVSTVSTVSPAATGSIAGLVKAEADTESAGNSARSRLTVDHRVDAQGHGHWVVNVPGTESWSPTMPPNPSDVTANLRGIAGVDSSLYPAVSTALAMAMAAKGIKPGTEPVMLVGHSQGGILAARLAANAQFRTRYNVTHLLTIAAPESRITIPKSVQALSIEHTADPVPRLDTIGRTDAKNRIRAVIDPRSSMDPAKKGLIDEHDGQLYARTARKYLGPDNKNPTLRRWYTDTHGFMNGTGDRYTYNLSRP